MMEDHSPESLDRAIAAVLRFPPIMRRMHREVFAKAQRKADIAIAYHHILIMKMLQEFGTFNSSELGALVFISNAQMTHSTEKLMKEGLIEKQRDTVDHRKVCLRLTPKGEQVTQRFDEFLLDFVRESLIGFSDSELEKLADSFDNIVWAYSR